MSFPVPDNESQRLRALRDFRVLDSLPQKMFDDITELAAGICGTPMALISLVDAERQWFKSRHGTTLTETPRNESFCAHTIMDTEGMLVVNDARTDARFANFPLVTSGEVRFYAGAPITTSDGHALGAMCVLDPQRRELSAAQRQQLQRLADLTMSLIEHEAHRRSESRMILDLVRKNERIIKNVLDEGREMCAFIDAQHRFLFVNPAYERYWTQPRESLIGMQVHELVGQALYRDVIKAGINQALTGQETLLKLDHAFPGTGLRHMEVRYVPARDERGRVHGVVERYRDVTELTDQADALRRHVAELDARRAVQDKYLHAISHDLKEPVNAINNAAPVLVERLAGTLPALEDRCLGYIERGGRRLARLLDDMRLFGELETGDIAVGRQPARALLEQCLARLHDEIGQRQAQVDLHADGDLLVDGPAFELAVRCTIEHVLRSSPARPVRLSVRLTRDGATAFIDVVDHGVATPLPAIAGLQRTERTGDAVPETPLSLSVARHIAHLHGGELQDDTAPEGWRRRRLVLPHGSPA